MYYLGRAVGVIHNKEYLNMYALPLNKVPDKCSKLMISSTVSLIRYKIQVLWEL